MSILPKNFTAIDAQVPAAAASNEIVSAEDGTVVAIDHVLLYNTTGGGVTVTFHRDTTGETPATANIIKTVTVATVATTIVSDLHNLRLNAGESLFASDSTGGQVNISVSGRVEYT